MKRFIGIIAAMAAICSCGAKVEVPWVDVPGFAKIINDTDNVTVLDVRTPAEYDGGHIEGAVNIDWQASGFMKKVGESVDKNKTVAVYCRSGRRSAAAGEALAKAGYKVVNLIGGYEAWSGDYFVVAYVTGWGREVVPDVSQMTHINYAFGKVKDTYDGLWVENEERLKMIVGLKSQKPELKVLLSIGGWGAGNFSEMAINPETRHAFALDCKRAVDEYGLDGIDLDWEYPTSSESGIGSDPTDTDNFTLLMKEIREAIGPDKYLTYASVWSAEYIDHKAILPYIDWVNIMSYDMGLLGRFISTGLYSSELTGPGTTDAALKAHIAAGIPRKMLTLGLAFYGRGKRDKFADYINFRDIDTTKTGFSVKWDDRAMVPYIVNDKGEFVFNYENPASLRIKSQYAIDNGLLGGMYWDYGADDDQCSLQKTVSGMFLGK